MSLTTYLWNVVDQADLPAPTPSQLDLLNANWSGFSFMKHQTLTSQQIRQIAFFLQYTRLVSIGTEKRLWFQKVTTKKISELVIIKTILSLAAIHWTEPLLLYLISLYSFKCCFSFCRNSFSIFYFPSIFSVIYFSVHP